MKKHLGFAIAALLVALLVSCTQYVYWPIYDYNEDNNTNNVSVIGTDIADGVYVVGVDSVLPVTVSYSNGTSRTIMVPADVINAAVGTETGVRTLSITYDGVTFAVDVYIPASDDVASDPNYINTAEKLTSLFTNTSGTEKIAVLADSFNIGNNNGYYIKDLSNIHIYSTDPSNTLTVTGITSSETAMYFHGGSNITLEGFTIKDGNPDSGTTKPLFKANGTTNLVLKDMRFETNQRGLDIHGNTDTSIINCTITKASLNYGELQIRKANGMIVDGLTIEDKEGTSNIGIIMFDDGINDSPEISKNVVLSNLHNVDTIMALKDVGVTVNDDNMIPSEMGNYVIYTNQGLV